MYTLTVSYLGKALRPRGPVTAPQALKDWSQEETTGYDVVCRNKKGASVTKGHLREVARHA